MTTRSTPSDEACGRAQRQDLQALHAARDKGITDPGLYESSRELDPIRGDPRFRQFLEKLPRPGPAPGGSS